MAPRQPNKLFDDAVEERVRRRGIVRHHNVRPKYTIEIDPPFREPRQYPPIAPPTLGTIFSVDSCALG